MKRYLHWWVTLFFLIAISYDLIVWGAAARLPDIGPKLQLSAQRQALLAHIYMGVGGWLDGAVPFFDDWGRQQALAALSTGFPRIKGDPMVAMDLIFSETWSAAHSMLKLMYWAAPVLALLALVLWSRRPKKVHLMRSR